MENCPQQVFSCLNEIRGKYPNQPLAFVDTYQDDEFLGGYGSFIDCIPNATAYHHSGFGNRIRDYSGQIVICCQLVNSEGRFRALQNKVIQKPFLVKTGLNHV